MVALYMGGFCWAFCWQLWMAMGDEFWLTLWGFVVSLGDGGLILPTKVGWGFH